MKVLVTFCALRAGVDAECQQFTEEALRDAAAQPVKEGGNITRMWYDEERKALMCEGLVELTPADMALLKSDPQTIGAKVSWEATK